MSGAGNATTMTPNPMGSVPAAAVGAASLAAALVKGQGQDTIRQGPGTPWLELDVLVLRTTCLD